MNDSDNKDTFSNTPKEDWTENDKTNLPSDTENVEKGELVEESSMPLREEEQITETQEETEEIMNIDNTVEQIEEAILDEEIQHEMTETLATENTEIQIDLEEEKIAESSEEELDIEQEGEFLEEEINIAQIEEPSFLEEEAESKELNLQIESNDFIASTEETLNGTQNDSLASLENTELNEASFPVKEEVIDLAREEATTNIFDNLEKNSDEDLFVETSTLIHADDNDEDMFKKPNFLFAILGGLAAILFSSLFWAETALLLDQHYNYDHKYAYMALFVAVCVGLGVRWAGRGTTYGYAILALVLTLFGSLSGTLLSTLVHVVEAFDVSYFDILDIFDFTFLYGLLEDRFQYLDIAFYVSAALLAYWLATRKESK